MKKLKGYFLNTIKDDKISDDISDAFNIEVNNYHLTNNLLPVSQSDDEKSLGMWWSDVFANHQYPNLFNLIKPCSLIFTGLAVFQVCTLTIYNLFCMKQNLAR